jgi:hypothetical protein
MKDKIKKLIEEMINDIENGYIRDIDHCKDVLKEMVE